jgi:hypothetical protein
MAADGRDDPQHAPLSWALAQAIAAGRARGPMPEDFFGPGFVPAEPTRARPGSPEKVDVLAARYARRERLFDPRDAR